MLRTAAGRLRCILKGTGIAPSMQVSLPNPLAMHSAVFVHAGALVPSPWRLSALCSPVTPPSACAATSYLGCLEAWHCPAMCWMLQVEPAAALADGLDCGDVLIGEAAEKQMTLTNTGMLFMCCPSSCSWSHAQSGLFLDADPAAAAASTPE